MEKIIFFTLATPMLIFVLYLAGSSIMKGFKAKEDNRSQTQNENENEISDPLPDDNQLSNELAKLNELHQNGVLTKEEFEKAKQKILDY
tara:strand:+ start:76 stop:342 length:267 start_codon:yes stop_codon:yes gene_type:complete